MSKKMQGKKNKRGLKRTVRRSMAAILMITAIAVAAIPVPDISADTGSTGTTSNTCLQCGKTHGELEYQVDISGADDIVASTPTVDLNDKTKYITTPNIFISKTAEYGILDWQYKLTRTGDGNKRYVLDYNTRYLAEDVYLRDNVEGEYETVSMDTYRAFYYNKADGQPKVVIKTSTKTGANYELIKKYFANYESFRNFDKDTEGKYPSIEITAEDFNSYYGTQSESMKQKFFCDKTEGYQGYTLYEVIDKLVDRDPSDPADVHSFVLKWLGEGALPSGTILDSNNFKVSKTYTIIGIADKAFAPKSDSDSAAYRIKNLTLGEQIKEIGDEAFKGCTTLQTINISNVDRIGDGAFKGCTNLHSVTMNPTVIGAEAFQGTNLSGEVTLGNAVTKIGAGAFAYSPISGVNFSNCTNINISKYAFYNCTSLTKVNFGDTNRNHIKSIGKGCFAVVNASSAGMTQFDFPFNLKSGTITEDNPNEGIADYVLAGRSALQKVTMPKEFSGVVPIRAYGSLTVLEMQHLTKICLNRLAMKDFTYRDRRSAVRQEQLLVLDPVLGMLRITMMFQFRIAI